LSSNVVSRDIKITTSNTAPFLTLNRDVPIPYVAGSPAVAIAPKMTIMDPDSPDMNRATIKFTSNYNSTQDKLVFTNTATLKGSWDPYSGTLNIYGIDTQANYVAAIHSVSYLNTSPTPSPLSRSVSLTVSDGLVTSNTVTQAITIFPVAQPPVLTTNIANPITYNPATGPLTITPAMNVTDPDSNNLTSVTIVFGANYQPGQDTLSFTNTATIIGFFDSNRGILTLSGLDTLQNYRAALQSVQYSFSGSSPLSQKVLNYFATDDMFQTSNPVGVTINVTP
jgi:hypothetical protein